MYEARQVARQEEIRPPITQSLYSVGSTTSENHSLPLVEEVTKRTEKLTKQIQELWLAMQDLSKRDTFVPLAERITGKWPKQSKTFNVDLFFFSWRF